METIIKNLVEQIDQLKIENLIYKDLFSNSPIAIWEEDITKLIEYFNKLKNDKIDELENFCFSNSEDLIKCFSMIKIINANNALVKILRAKSKEYLIENRHKVYTNNTIQDFVKILNFILKGGTSFKGETEAKAFDGKIIKFEVAFEIYKRTDNGELKYFRIMSLTDITKRLKIQKTLIEAENNLRHILDNSIDIIFLLDSDAKILDVNERKLKILKSKRDEVIGNSLFDYMDSHLMAENLKRLEQVVKERTELNVIDEINDTFWNSRLCPIIENDKITKFVLFNREITDYVKIKNENIKLKNEQKKILEEMNHKQKLKKEKISNFLMNIIAQELVVIKLNLYNIKQQNQIELTQLKDEINIQITELEKTIVKLKNISFELDGVTN